MITKIWAHRGASSQAPENTLAAFDLAIRLGADGIELDVHLTADKVVVVTHDESCRRVAGEDGRIGDMTLSELRQLDFGRIKPGFTRQPIPTLADVFDLIRPSGLTINIELKNSINLYPGLEQQVLDLAAEGGMLDRICLSSFNHYSMAAARQIIKERTLAIPCGLLYSSLIYHPWDYARKLDVTAIHPMYNSLLIPGLVGHCREAGIAINVWTIDLPEHLSAAIGMNPDAIITNVPDQALTIRRQQTERDREDLCSH